MQAPSTEHCRQELQERVASILTNLRERKLLPKEVVATAHQDCSYHASDKLRARNVLEHLVALAATSTEQRHRHYDIRSIATLPHISNEDS